MSKYEIFSEKLMDAISNMVEDLRKPGENHKGFASFTDSELEKIDTGVAWIADAVFSAIGLEKSE